MQETHSTAVRNMKEHMNERCGQEADSKCQTETFLKANCQGNDAQLHKKNLSARYSSDSRLRTFNLVV